MTKPTANKAKPAQSSEAREAAFRAQLAKLGIVKRWDLLTHLPLRYEDETHLTAICDAREGTPVLIEAVVTACEAKRIANKGREQLVVQLSELSATPNTNAMRPLRSETLIARFLNFYPSQLKQFTPGKRLRLFGEVKPGFFGAEIVHPRVRVVREGEALRATLTPVYPTTAGVSQDRLRTLIEKTLAQTELTETLPAQALKRYELQPFAQALTALHTPTPAANTVALEERTTAEWRRLKFDELLAQQIAMQTAHAERALLVAPALGDGASEKLVQQCVQALPFKLTKAQQRALEQIQRDLSQSKPMQRLLQGDVGSGKTVVATLAALQAIGRGYQAAFVAPTEILAEQHYRKTATLLEPLGIKVAWLAGALKPKEKTLVRSQIALGEVQLAIGTHALFTEDTIFDKLGLAIIDEQHRFGVVQRLQLTAKAQPGYHVHQLMMSATPIPRTLAMSYWADLDVSTIDERPPGRKPIKTHLVEESRRDEVVGRIRDAIKTGAQAYWVCPLIEESEKLQLETATQTYESLAQTFPELRIGLVHGRLKAKEKDAVMQQFIAREVDLLVATTVIEVGVDVPNAALMVIENAERMGLAQLHQLRGRVGRGERESRCVLLYKTPLSETGRARLKIIYENDDGFDIARQDLLIRGPGEFLGSRQSGVQLLRFADPERDAELVEAAHGFADAWMKEDPEAAQRHCQRWMGTRKQLMNS